MSRRLTCPSCSADNPKRVIEIVQQQTSIGAQAALASRYNPPKQPWAYLQGFALGVPVNTVIMLSMTSPEASEATIAVADIVSSIGFLSVWIGYGMWKNKAYTQKFDEWKKTIASKMHCLQCNHVFDA